MKAKHLLVALIASAGLLASCGEQGGQGGSSNDPGQSQSQTYRITWVAGDGYEYSFNKDEAAAGTTVAFRVTPTGDQVISGVFWNGNKITPSTGANPVYRFTMPEENVTITVVLAVVSSISVDASQAKTAYLVGGEFDKTGLVVKAQMEGSSEQLEVSSYTITEPDLSSVGTKSVTINYGGKTASYDIKVGSFEATSVALKKTLDKVLLEIGGNYSGFASAAELTKAAKGDAGIDIQSNDNYGGQGWDRYHDSDEITYDEGAAAGTFTVSTEVSDLKAGGGSGYGYSIHFGLVITDEGNSEVGNPVNLDISSFSTTPLEVGTRTYSLWYNSTWGVTSLTISNSEAPFVSHTVQDLQLLNDIPTVVLEGEYGYLDDQYDDWFFMDVMQFDSWARPEVKAATVTKTPNASDARIGTYHLEFPLIGEENNQIIAVLNDSNSYFFHFGHHTSGDGTNITALEGLQEKSVTDSRGDKYTLFRNPSSDWKGGLLSVKVETANFVARSKESLIKDSSNHAILKVEGTSHGYPSTSEKFRIDCQSLDAWETIEIAPQVNVNAQTGDWSIEVDLTGKLAEGYTYFFHFGESTGTNGEGEPSYANLYASEATQGATIIGSDGAYQLSVGADFSGDNGWRNGLVLVTYDPGH